MGTAKDNAIGLYMDGIRDGNPREAIARYTGARYTQHSSGVADGQDGFIAFFEPFIARNPVRDIKIVRALQDGPKVFIQAHQSLNEGEAVWITTDFFDSDADGQIIEHWDVIEADAAQNPSGRTKTDGATDVTDLGQTDANKALVADFMSRCLIGRETDAMAEFIDPDRFQQHASHMGDGLETFQSFYGATDCPLSYQECFMMVGEGNFVATLNRARMGAQDLCHVDLYRLDQGRIVEHWDNSEPVPPKETWANGGKF